MPAGSRAMKAEIFRLGLVQASIGAIAVLMISTLNRVLVIEYALPAVIPGTLVGLHYLVQFIRPRVGHEADAGVRLSRWILGGTCVFAAASILCAASTLGLAHGSRWGLLIAASGYALVGLGIGAAGTSLLILMTQRIEPERRGAAAAVMWIMMIGGFALTAGVTGRFLDPFSPGRLIVITTLVALVACAVTAFAVHGADAPMRVHRAPRVASISFFEAFRAVWNEKQARDFTLFIFVSMLAYSAEEILLEPFAGVVFNYSLGASTRLSGTLHGAAFAGMCCVALLTRRRTASRKFPVASLSVWTLMGCVASGAALAALAYASAAGALSMIRPLVVCLGLANGVFAVATVGAMMDSATMEEPGRAGMRIGIWGAAQALAFALGGISSTSLVDGLRIFTHSSSGAFAAVFIVQSALFLTAAGFSLRGALRGSAGRRSLDRLHMGELT